MADISQTAANVVEGSDATVLTGLIAGEAITAGCCVYRKSSDGKYYKAQNDDVVEAAAVGIALNTADGAGQRLAVATAGTVNLGATLTVGEVYCVSNTAGAICPVADIGQGEYQTILGVATTAALLKLGIIASGVAHA